MNMLTAALHIASDGKPVFPCVPGGKRPITRNGFKSASVVADYISCMWAPNPAANIGLPTGAVSGVIVLDVDLDREKGKNGTLVLSELERAHGALPKTFVVATPRGGRHYYFRHPGRDRRISCSTDKLGMGLDIRGDGGYVIVPPSRTLRGVYRVEVADAVADMPEWLLLRLEGRRPKGVGSAPVTISRLPVLGEDMDRIQGALGFIDAGLPHDDWVRILMALHSWDPVRGRDLALKWSANCRSKFRESDFESAWRSFTCGGGVGLGTLFELAGRCGWRKLENFHMDRNNSSAVAQEDSDLHLTKWPDPPRAEAFHGVFGEFAQLLRPHTESDPMAILVQAIVAFGNLIGHTSHFLVEADKHFANLNCVVVGNSSKARKGTSWGHVQRLLREVDATWPPAISGISTGEGLISCVRNPVFKLAKDGTSEVVDAGVPDKRAIVVESEFGRTLQCGNRDGNTLTAVVRQAFDNGDLRVATKGSPQTATDAHISIIGHITSEELNLLLSKSDCANGFANRMLWLAVKRSQLLPDGGNSASLDFSGIVSKLRKAVEFAKGVGCVSRDEKARELWTDIYFRLSVERPGLLGAVVSRAEALVMRLALIFAVGDCSHVIRDAHLRAAVAVWDYCEASAAFVFGRSLGNPLSERVMSLLREAPSGGLSRGQIHQKLSGHISSDELNVALTQLHNQGLAEFRDVSTGGRPAQFWLAAGEDRSVR